MGVGESGVGETGIARPNDVELTKECVMVVDWSPNCVHFFSREGTLLSSCISQGMEQDCSVSCPRYFCLDTAKNIIISDTNNHAIKIFSQSGQHIHTVGKVGVQFSHICIFIVVVFKNR